MALTRNYYELLDVPINASTEEIKTAYENKLMRAVNDGMTEQYKTAYYHLCDARRRQKYDLRLGIHKYKTVPRTLRIAKGAGRLILTVLDSLCALYWCFFVAVILLSGGYLIYRWKSEGIAVDVLGFLSDNIDAAIVLIGLGAEDFIAHFYIRRANRFLKHYDWEYRVEEQEETPKDSRKKRNPKNMEVEDV